MNAGHVHVPLLTNNNSRKKAFNAETIHTVILVKTELTTAVEIQEFRR